MRYIHPTAIVGDNVIIEDNVYIGPYCLIGLEPEWKGHENENQGVIIKSGTRLTGHVTIDGGGLHRTYIGSNCYLMKHSHIGHDAIIGDNVTISCGAKIGGHSIVGDNCNIGLNAVIHQHKSIPYGCMIGMGAVVTKKLEMKPQSKYVGNPAKYLSENIKK